MDRKASVRSKRAQSSLHSKRRHRPSIPSHPTPVPLRSNWDRYEDDEEDNAPDTVLPKSKGADYRHLLEESRSHVSPPFDDDLLDSFTGGVAEKMLSVKGERITTWIENENFIVDGDANSSSFKVPVLSFNLRALADQLEKVELSRRLFIESDFESSETEPSAQKQSEHEKSDKLKGLTDIGEKNDQPHLLKTASAKEENNRSSKRNLADSSAVESELDELISSLEETDIRSSFRNKLTLKENPKDTIQRKFGKVDASNSQNLEAELDALLSSSNDRCYNTSERSELRINLGEGFEQNGKQKMKADNEEICQPSYDKSESINDFDSWMDSL